jgi:hypothetical protein
MRIRDLCLWFALASSARIDDAGGTAVSTYYDSYFEGISKTNDIVSSVDGVPGNSASSPSLSTSTSARAAAASAAAAPTEDGISADDGTVHVENLFRRLQLTDGGIRPTGGRISSGGFLGSNLRGGATPSGDGSTIAIPRSHGSRPTRGGADGPANKTKEKDKGKGKGKGDGPPQDDDDSPPNKNGKGKGKGKGKGDNASENDDPPDRNGKGKGKGKGDAGTTDDEDNHLPEYDDMGKGKGKGKGGGYAQKRTKRAKSKSRLAIEQMFRGRDGLRSILWKIFGRLSKWIIFFNPPILLVFMDVMQLTRKVTRN